MKLLLDENCRNLKNYLIEMGWETYDVRDVLDRKAGENSINDNRILHYAKENKLIIITKDQGLRFQCINKRVPCLHLGSPNEEANKINQKINEILTWKEYI